MFEVIYDNVELTEYIKVKSNFSRGIDRRLETIIRDVDGAEFITLQDQRTKELRFDMPFSVRKEKKLAYEREFARLVFKKGLFELVFSDEPDLVYYATVVDVQTSEEFGMIDGVISFLVPDGLRHSKRVIEHMFVPNNEGILEVVLVNNGNYPVPISYEIRNNSDNGFIGLVASDGVIQLGNIEEADTQLLPSEYFFKYKGFNQLTAAANGWGKVPNGQNYLFRPGLQNTGGNVVQWIQTNQNNMDFASLSNYGTGDWWHGTQMRKVFSAEGVNNFILEMQMKCDEVQMNQVGHVDVCISSDDGWVTGIHMTKYASGTTGLHVDLIDNRRGSDRKEVKYRRFMDVANGFNRDTNKYSRDISGVYTISRLGDVVTFALPTGEKYSYTSEAGVVYKNIAYGFHNMSTYAPPLRLGVHYIAIRPYEDVDVSNRYADGDVVVIDGESGFVGLRKDEKSLPVPIYGDIVTGSRFFKAPVGKSVVQAVYSSFATNAPSFKAKIREVY